jgi:amidohydrolase
MSHTQIKTAQGKEENKIVAAAHRWYPAQVKWRRHLHQHPETALQEFETTAFLKKELRRLGLTLRPLKLRTGVIAELKGDRPGPTVAIRSDIDALSVLEQTGLPFASRTVGRMHACGHDMHMAIILGTAAILAERRKELKGSVRFLFQPAEESAPGGAILLVKEGVLRGVDVIFGLHVDPSIGVGKIGLRDGPMMASVCDFDVTITGRGSHAAKPHLGVDAIVIAAAVIQALQTVVSRRTDQLSPVVLSIGQINGGTARNVIASNVRLIGTVRALDLVMAKKLPGLITKTVTSVSRSHDAIGETSILAAYPPVVNDAAVNRLYADVFSGLFGRKQVVQADQSLGGEDFAYYLQKVPGAMLRLGIRNRKIGADQPWHSSKFIADENALWYGAALMAAATIKYTEESSK